MRSTLPALGAVLMLTVAVPPAMAQGGLVITSAWARATPGGAQTAAVYATLESSGGDRLTGVSTPAAQTAELHMMTMDGGVMKMRQVDGIDLPAGQAVTLKPGGYHIMLTGLAKPLQEGQSFPLTFAFAKAGPREVDAAVQKIGAMGPESQADGQGGGTDIPAHH